MVERPERQYRTRYHAQWVRPVSAPLIEDGTVVVEHDRIVYTGPRSGAPAARDVELGHSIITPGLVNAHTHLDLTVLRGRLAGLSFFEWIRALVAAREQLPPRALLDSARLGIREGLRLGVTTYADTAPNDAPFEAMLELGVRGIAYREVFGPDPTQCATSLGELKGQVAQMRARETGRVKVGVSPHAPYSVSGMLYREVAAYARAEGLPLATHVAESEEETRLVTRGEGDFAAFLRGRAIAVGPTARSPVSLLEACEVLAPNALLIHCVRVDARDIAAIAAHGSGVALCPLSNAYFGHGAAPVGALHEAGVRLGVGSDSMASNDTMDVLAEAAYALRESSDGKSGPDPNAVWELATIGGARALGMEHETGSLEVGKQADLAVFPVLPGVDPSTVAAPVGRGSTPAMQASMVIVAGRVILSNDRWRLSPPIH